MDSRHLRPSSVILNEPFLFWLTREGLASRWTIRGAALAEAGLGGRIGLRFCQMRLLIAGILKIDPAASTHSIAIKFFGNKLQTRSYVATDCRKCSISASC